MLPTSVVGGMSVDDVDACRNENSSFPFILHRRLFIRKNCVNTGDYENTKALELDEREENKKLTQKTYLNLRIF